MSIRHLDALLRPASVALIGVSARPGSLGATVWRNLQSGAFAGRLYGVNPKYRELDGQPVWRRVADLPEAPALALICTPPAQVPGLIKQLGQRGTRAVVVLTGGLNSRQRQAMLDAARPHLLRIVGPNCLGVLSPHLGLNASFAESAALPGELAFVSQSGSLVTALLDWARARGIGFSHFVSLGEHADVDFGDLLDYLASDQQTRAILLYIESITAAAKFMSAARAAARNKPVIVVKAGRSAAGARAALAHTGAAPAQDAVIDAALRRAGLLRVLTLQDLFLALQTVSRFRDNPGGALTIVTNGGGAGVLAADAAADAGVVLAELTTATQQALAALLPPNAVCANPIDLVGDAPIARYLAVLQMLLPLSPDGALLLIHAPTAIVSAQQLAQALLPLLAQHPQRLMACWLGDAAVAGARALFEQAGVACYDTPEQAVRAYAMLQTYRRNHELLLQAPALGDDVRVDTSALVQVLAQALPAGRSPWLLEDAPTQALLSLCGVRWAEPAQAPVLAQAMRLRLVCQIDPWFGPVIELAAAGWPFLAGTRAVALPPLNRPLARALIEQAGLLPMLQANAQVAAADVAALERLLLVLAQLLAELPQLERIEIDPLLLDHSGALALGAQVRLNPAAPAGAQHFVIRPYPAQLLETLNWHGQALTLRPIRPQDEAQHLRFLARLRPADIRMRLFHTRRNIARTELARLTQIDYAREMAFIAEQPVDAQNETLGVVRAIADPDNQAAEFGLIVRSDIKGGGLGRLLLDKMIDYLRRQGTRRLVASVFADNDRMLGLARRLGFVQQPDEPGDDTCRIVLEL